ncbi:MAG: HDOD domain-containing protein [Phycisphaerae bacterium]|jgi:putative nucleotidyltransferase with HDIG domain
MAAKQVQHDPWAAGRLTSAQREDLLRRFNGRAVLPSVAVAVLEAMERQISAGAAELSAELLDIVRCDPLLTARVLSAAASLASPPMTLAAAVGGLSADAVRAELLALAAMSPKKVHAAGPMVPRQLQRHSLAVALAAEMIASRLGGTIEPAEAYTCGLLHDLGKLVLAAGLPKSFQRAAELATDAHGDISDMERQVIGIDHATIGHRLAEMWRLAPTLAEIIWLHHQPPAAIPAAAPVKMIELVGLADAVARTLQLGFSGNYVFAESLEEQAGRLGLAPLAVEEVCRQLPAVLEHRDRLEESPDAHIRHHRSVARLAARLADVHGHVRARAEEAEVQADAFRHLRHFAATLSGQASVADALHRIAELVAGVCDWQPSADQPVLAYAVGQADEAVQMLRHDGSRPPDRRMLRPGKSTPVPPAGPSAADAMAALLADPQDVADWADLPTWRHWPLVCAGRWVGGVLLPAAKVAAPAAAVLDAVAGALAMALAVVQGKCRTTLLSEELAEALQRQAAAQQAQTEARTISAIGEMAAGAAHELNNPLAVISGRAQLMRDKAAGAEERKTWSLIADQAQRISDTVTALMDFASPPPPQPAAVDAFSLLKSAAEAFSLSPHPQAAAAQVDIEVADDTPPALADADQIRSAIVEAITNAATAAQGQPHIHLEARGGDDGQSVLLIVSDDGPGMDAATLERVFTPFFSSQRAGRRQGLGLPRARRYVENNAGKIWITSQRGQGTQLRIQLPRA